MFRIKDFTPTTIPTVVNDRMGKILLIPTDGSAWYTARFFGYSLIVGECDANGDVYEGVITTFENLGLDNCFSAYHEICRCIDESVGEVVTSWDDDTLYDLCARFVPRGITAHYCGYTRHIPIGDRVSEIYIPAKPEDFMISGVTTL